MSELISLDDIEVPGTGPVVPRDDDWVEFATENEAALDAQEEELKQQWHKLHAAVDSGEDERGPFDVIPLAMLRGGKAEEHVVYKKPMKHLVVSQSIPPRGWYKNKHEKSDRIRPRPCLLPDTMLSAPDVGELAIQDFKSGDVVLGRFDWGIGDAEILDTIQHKAPGYYNVKLSNGLELNITKGHPVWVVGEGWVEIEKLSEGYKAVKLEGFTLDLDTTLVHINAMTYIDGEVDVYDIQTMSENFYASGVLVHNCYSEALLTTPYGGFCPVGCAFCYINNGSRGYRSTGIPTVDPDYPEKFQKQFKKMRVSGAGYMTSFSEAFHVLEDTYHVTQRLTNVFLEDELPIFYCTRRLPAEWAIEALQANPYSYIQWSVNTSNLTDYKRLSPGAAKLDEVFRYVERLAKLKIYTSFQCNPIHPGITTLEELVELVRISGQVGLRHIIFKFVEQVANARNVIVDRLKSRRFDPIKVAEFDELFNQMIGGVYTIQQDVRIAWLEELLKATRKANITMSLCYEYYADGKAGSNMAPYFTTSDQCHGRGIPVHYRPALGEKFQPFPCYRKGCLYCEETGTQACNSEELLQASALQYKDLQRITIEEPEDGWDWYADDSCAHPGVVLWDEARNPGLATDAELWGWDKPWEV